METCRACEEQRVVRVGGGKKETSMFEYISRSMECMTGVACTKCRDACVSDLCCVGNWSTIRITLTIANCSH
jgi:hypothetical protein